MKEITEYYAKSANSQGHCETVKEHLQKVSVLACKYGEPFGLGDAAGLAGQVHDFGKYSRAFQDVLRGTQTGIDHAVGGACYLEGCCRKSIGRAFPVIEAVNGHHDGLLSYEAIKGELHAIISGKAGQNPNTGKTPAIVSSSQLKEANDAFRADFPGFRPPASDSLPAPPSGDPESMLYTRMLFSCLVDADYTASAINDDESYADRAEDDRFDPQALLDKLHTYREDIRKRSTADESLNEYRDIVFEQCGKMGDEPEGLYTLTAPTGTGKTLALLNFALHHCLKHGKTRIIIVLPFLTLAEQNAAVYSEIIPNLLIDHSQSELPEDARELAARWSAPFIITTSVRFFESLFSNRPTACRKLHNIANSVVVFDEAQSLPANLASATVCAVNELCRRYHTTMVFSTATQPDFSALKNTEWNPREIIPQNAEMFKALRRVNVEWRLESDIPLGTVAEEMSRLDSVCAVVNLRRHAREIADILYESCPEETVFFLTTDMCPAHRSRQVESIKYRLAHGLPCRVVATQCIEAGVDLDFGVMYRALAPLDSIVQAAGRCNRNGRDAQGRVVVFCPDDEKYPDNWYKQAAIKVREMRPADAGFSIHDPETIREYYRLLFDGASDKEELKKAIEERSFIKTAEQYRLISGEGAKVIVPYPAQRKRFERTAKQLREHGVTKALLKEAAPITVNCFDKALETYAEEIPFARRGAGPVCEKSNIFLIRPQYEDVYTPQFGLRFAQKEQFDCIF